MVDVVFECLTVRNVDCFDPTHLFFILNITWSNKDGTNQTVKWAMPSNLKPFSFSFQFLFVEKKLI